MKTPSAGVTVSADVKKNRVVTVLLNFAKAVPSPSNFSQLPKNGAASSLTFVLSRIRTRSREVGGWDSDGRSGSRSEDWRRDKLEISNSWTKGD